MEAICSIQKLRTCHAIVMRDRLNMASFKTCLSNVSTIVLEKGFILYISC